MSVRTKLPKSQRKGWVRFLSDRDDAREVSSRARRRLAGTDEAGELARPHCERAPRRRPEQALQRAVLDHLELWAVPNCYWFHVGNGGYRTPTEARVLKSLGV